MMDALTNAQVRGQLIEFGERTNELLARCAFLRGLLLSRDEALAERDKEIERLTEEIAALKPKETGG